MDVRSLIPPDNLSLSDEIVGSVLQRILPANTNNHRPQYCFSYQSIPESHSAEILTTINSVKPRMHVSTKVSNDKIRHREYRRAIQARSRKKKKQYVSDLECGVQNLRLEVQQLELQRCRALLGIPTQQTAWTVALEYFRIFCRGFKDPPQALYSFALRFLQESMLPDVNDGLVVGPHAMLENWGRFSSSFDDVRVDLNRLEKVSANSLFAVTTTSATISYDALRVVFPHLKRHLQCGVSEVKGSLLACKLLNYRLSMRGSVRFEWDDRTDRVSSMDSRSDMLTPLLNLLGNLDDVNYVFRCALVTPDCRFLVQAN
ncbi:hypothetical protein PPTG_14616 [Phytophthora nicotianae INRA-310]|uniref:BZIP domain-containing protein n=2 Tax=Phytophthora nicotianae TaxID=4792 RepID=W2PW55_PHYN3|nr:hypothetical protein PPTG_14616 [Phytophthora nicotianae INRA-310]ETN04856.1 hypothetical protein PPTG_14616 [Phytophthora nicotianae INRA-310]